MDFNILMVSMCSIIIVILSLLIFIWVKHKKIPKLSPTQRCLSCIHNQVSRSKYGSRLQYCSEKHEAMLFSPYSCRCYEKR